MPLVKFLQREKIGGTSYAVGTIADLPESSVAQLEVLGISRGKPILKRLGKQLLTNDESGSLRDITPGDGEHMLIRNDG